MNRLPAIPADFVLTLEEAMAELHQRGWSVGHAAFDGVHQVSGHRGEARFVANASTELDAWLMACEKANEQERIWNARN